MSDIRQALTGLTLALPLFWTQAAWADTAKPASAIPWLTDSLQSDTASPPPTEQPTSPSIETISVEVLRDNGRDGLGILTRDLTGFPGTLWQGVAAPKVMALIRQTPHAGVPAVRSLFRQILLAEVDVSRGNFKPDSLLLTRIDRLLEIGALSEAQALIELVGPDTSELFRRWFDIGLLTNQADLACSELNASPMLSPARTVQVFCLALRRDWDAAATALALGEELGQITQDEADLLSFFLDEALLEEIEPPPFGVPLTSLEFVIRESVGLPRPQTPLPVAFMHAELADYMPLRFRIEAAEVLVRAGVLPSSVLFAAYREEDPAASGGVWERLATTQAMDAASTADEISEALAGLDTEFKRAGLRMAASEEFLLYLSELPADQFNDPARNTVALYLLLADASELAEGWISSSAPLDIKTALSISSGDLSGPSKIEQVLRTTTPETYLSDYQGAVISGGRIGEAMMAAIELLSRDEDIDEGDLLQGLALLRATGQDEIARQIAVQTLLLTLELANGK